MNITALINTYANINNSCSANLEGRHAEKLSLSLSSYYLNL